MQRRRQKLTTRSMLSVPVRVEDGRRIVTAARALDLSLAEFCRRAILDRVALAESLRRQAEDAATEEA
jgi:hypothetical protein